jgi:nitroimidazol reductase NimA-like FMN-containing flavoprotein (pyridoxamine 5'-phosphate oxidase superfamily)
VDERITIMTNEEIAEILAKPYAQQLLNGPEPARMAYVGLDGGPRVIPIGFWTEGARIVMATVPKSAKVAALQTIRRLRSRSTRAPSRRRCC